MQCSIIYSIQYIISSQFYTIVPNVITSIILIILIMWNRRGSTAGTENKCSFYSTLVNTEPIYSTPVQVFWCFCTSRWSLYLLLALCLDHLSSFQQRRVQQCSTTHRIGCDADNSWLQHHISFREIIIRLFQVFSYVK